jgi:hypothetical protein
MQRQHGNNGYRLPRLRLRLSTHIRSADTRLRGQVCLFTPRINRSDHQYARSRLRSPRGRDLCNYCTVAGKPPRRPRPGTCGLLSANWRHRTDTASTSVEAAGAHGFPVLPRTTQHRFRQFLLPQSACGKYCRRKLFQSNTLRAENRLDSKCRPKL